MEIRNIFSWFNGAKSEAVDSEKSGASTSWNFSWLSGLFSKLFGGVADAETPKLTPERVSKEAPPSSFWDFSWITKIFSGVFGEAKAEEGTGEAKAEEGTGGATRAVVSEKTKTEDAGLLAQRRAAGEASLQAKIDASKAESAEKAKVAQANKLVEVLSPEAKMKMDAWGGFNLVDRILQTLIRGDLNRARQGSSTIVAYSPKAQLARFLTPQVTTAATKKAES
jgi:hypothetical protein